MPPKNKKEQQEQAKKLEAERLRQQEEQRLIQIQKAKYASTEISTGLILPVTSLLLQQFPTKPLSFIIQKLNQYIVTLSPNLISNPTLLKVIQNQFLANILFVIDHFGVTHKNQKIRQQNYEKGKVFIGIMSKVFNNNHPELNISEQAPIKSKQQDWILFKQLILKHSFDDPPSKVKYFDKDIVKKIIEFAERGYFGHYNLIMNFGGFKKKEEVKREVIYIDKPQIFKNTKETKFTDLSPPPIETHKETTEQSKVKIQTH